MGRTEILKGLFKKRLGLSNAYYTQTEIARFCKLDISNVAKSLNEFVVEGLVDLNLKGAWKKAYRLSDGAFINIQKEEARE